MRRASSLRLAAGCAAVVFLAAPAISLGAQFASELVASQFVTFFGSALVTGPPDNGGAFLGDTTDPPANPGFLTVRFATPLVDGPGVDLRIVDVIGTIGETASIEVSTNGTSFTLVGQINALSSALDIAGGFANPFSFVRIANTSTAFSMDVDAVVGEHEIPEPTAPLALVAAAAAARRRIIRGGESAPRRTRASRSARPNHR